MLVHMSLTIISLAAPDPTTLKKKGLGKLNTTKRGATGM